MQHIDIHLSTPRTSGIVSVDDAIVSDVSDPLPTLSLRGVKLTVVGPLVLPLKSYDAIRDIDVSLDSFHLYAGNDVEAKIERSIFGRVHIMSKDDLRDYPEQVPQGDPYHYSLSFILQFPELYKPMVDVSIKEDPLLQSMEVAFALPLFVRCIDSNWTAKRLIYHGSY